MGSPGSASSWRYRVSAPPKAEGDTIAGIPTMEAVRDRRRPDASLVAWEHWDEDLSREDGNQQEPHGLFEGPGSSGGFICPSRTRIVVRPTTNHQLASRSRRALRCQAFTVRHGVFWIGNRVVPAVPSHSIIEEEVAPADGALR